MKFTPLCIVSLLVIVRGDNNEHLRKEHQPERKALEYATDVSFLYTYGAPAMTREAIGDNTVDSFQACVPGSRVFTRNWMNHYWYCDFAAVGTYAFNFAHPTMDVIQLEQNMDNGRVTYQYEECEKRNSAGEVFDGRSVWYYPRLGPNIPYPPIHDLGFYQNRMWYMRDALPNFEPTFNYTKFTRCMNGRQDRGGFADCLVNGDYGGVVFEGGWDKLTSETWNVIGYGIFDGAPWDAVDNFQEDTTPDEMVFSASGSRALQDDSDKDRVAVVKKNPSTATTDKSTDCLIVFQGSDARLDYIDMGEIITRTYCGWTVHWGGAYELSNMVRQDAWSTQIQPALRQCSSISAVGHSLGGAMADIFTMCANYGDKSSSDYINLMW